MKISMAEMLSALITPLIEITKWAFKTFRKPTPVQILKRREELKREFEKRLPPKDQHGVHCEAIIRDIRRMDSYPDIHTRHKGISAWFKVEVKGLYHRGVEVFFGVRRRIKKDMYGEWRFADYTDEETVLVYPVGRIPFDLIEYVNWDGDEHGGSPHIYCRFKTFKGQPYEAILFFSKYLGSEDLIEVKGFRPWDKKNGSWISRLRE